MNLPEEVRRAWADRCGLSWDENDDRVREPEKYGWPQDFEIFYAGWKSAYAVAQDRVPDSPALPWTGDVQGRRPDSCATSVPSVTAPAAPVTSDERALLREALAGLVGLAEQAGMNTHGFVIHAKRFLIQQGVLPESPSAESATLLKSPRPLPAGCYCNPGKCMAPRPEWCRDEAKRDASK